MVASFEGRSEPRGRTRDRLVRVKLERAIRPTGAARRPDQKPGKRMNWLGVHSSGWSWIGHAVHDPDSPDDAGFARAPGQRALTSAISRFSRPGTGIWTPPSPLVLLDLDVNRLSESGSVSYGGGHRRDQPVFDTPSRHGPLRDRTRDGLSGPSPWQNIEAALPPLVDVRSRPDTADDDQAVIVVELDHDAIRSDLRRVVRSEVALERFQQEMGVLLLPQCGELVPYPARHDAVARR